MNLCAQYAIQLINCLTIFHTAKITARRDDRIDGSTAHHVCNLLFHHHINTHRHYSQSRKSVGGHCESTYRVQSDTREQSLPLSLVEI